MLQDLAAMPEYREDQTPTYELKKVHRGTKEWKVVEKEMKKGPEFDINIINIDRILNQGLWNEYTQSRQSISEKNKGEINERKLFHGTRDKNPAEICECGFGDSTKEIFGDRLGVFFAVVAKYAAKKYAYAVDKDHGQVFLAKVITGRSYRLPIQEQGTEEDMDESPTDSRIKGSPDNGDEVYGTFESNLHTSSLTRMLEVELGCRQIHTQRASLRNSSIEIFTFSNYKNRG